MDETTLLDGSGDRRVDAVLREVIGNLEAALPARVRSYYLFGSHADESRVATSDIDLCLVSRGAFTAAETDQWRRIVRAGAPPGGPGLDVIALVDEDLLRDGHFRIEANSRLLYGDDLRGRIPRQSFDRYLGRYVHAPWDYIVQVLHASTFRAAGSLVYPLDYPDPNGEFYGYDRSQLAHRDELAQNIQALVNTACWIATMIVAFEAGRTVATKAASIRLYREVIADEWTPWLEALYEHGNRRLGYLVPAAPADRRLLRDLCAPMPAFENRYLRFYRDILLARCREGGAGAAEAAGRLGEIVYPDDETAATLRALAVGGDGDVRPVAAASLRRVREALGRR
jgi:predicted nucleotidyltransferase